MSIRKVKVAEEYVFDVPEHWKEWMKDNNSRHNPFGGYKVVTLKKRTICKKGKLITYWYFHPSPLRKEWKQEILDEIANGNAEEWNGVVQSV